MRRPRCFAGRGVGDDDGGGGRDGRLRRRDEQKSPDERTIVNPTNVAMTAALRRRRRVAIVVRRKTRGSRQHYLPFTIHDAARIFGFRFAAGTTDGLVGWRIAPRRVPVGQSLARTHSHTHTHTRMHTHTLSHARSSVRYLNAPDSRRMPTCVVRFQFVLPALPMIIPIEDVFTECFIPSLATQLIKTKPLRDVDSRRK